MQTLRRVLASGVLDALRKRDHVVVAPEHRPLLCSEVEAVIAPQLEEVASHLAAVRSSHPARNCRAASATSRRSSSSLRFVDPRGDEAVTQMVQRIAARIMESDHVDDIFADDKVIRRDTLRAIKRVLLGYVRGEIEIEDDGAGETFVVTLDSLGYVVSTVAAKVDPSLLVDALERAAAAAGGTLTSVDAGVCRFCARGGAETTRLAIEEAISQELVALADAELVELPAVEQVLEISDGSALDDRFADALYRAELSARQETGCLASCTVIDRYTLIATLTPQSSDAAANAETLFDRFLAILEAAIAGADSPTSPGSASLPSSLERSSLAPTSPGLSPLQDRDTRAAAPKRAQSKRPHSKQASSKQAPSKDAVPKRGRKARAANDGAERSRRRGRAAPQPPPSDSERVSRTRARGRKPTKKRGAKA